MNPNHRPIFYAPVGGAGSLSASVLTANSNTNLSTFPNMLDWICAGSNAGLNTYWRLTAGGVITAPSLGANAATNAWFISPTLSFTTLTASDNAGALGGGITDNGTQSYRLTATNSTLDAYLNFGAPAVRGSQRKVRFMVGTNGTVGNNFVTASLADGSAPAVSVTIPSGNGSYYIDFTYTGGSNTTLIPVLNRAPNESGELHWSALVYGT